MESGTDRPPSARSVDEEETKSAAPAGLDDAWRTAAHLAAGDRLGRFTVREELGSGGMGVVFRAHDARLDREVALKLLKAHSVGASRDDTGQARLVREAQAMARLNHPNVVAVFDVGSLTLGADEQGPPAVYIAMELVEGIDLKRWLRGHVRSRDEILDVFLQAGRGLAAAHDAGIVHRDFKPANVLVGARGRARVLDFGLARPTGSTWGSSSHGSGRVASPLAGSADTGEDLTAAGLVIGTPGYMAPEQLSGGFTDGRSDQFAFCVALYEALSGVRPFRARNASASKRLALIRRGHLDPAANQRVGRRLLWVLRRGMAFDAADRFPSMGALLDAVSSARRTSTSRWAAGAALLAVGTTGWMLTPSFTDSCEDAAEEIAAVWNDEIAARAGSAFTSVDDPEARAWPELRRTLDDKARQWSALRIEECRATSAQARTEGSRSPVVGCLERTALEIAALVEMLEDADARVVREAPGLADAIMVDGCRDRAVDEALADLTGPQLAELEGIEKDIARAWAHTESSRYTEARAILEPAIDRARELGVVSVLVRALRTSGTLEAHDGSYPRAAERDEECYFLAFDNGLDEDAAECATHLITVLGQRLTRHEEAMQWEGPARAAIDRAGRPVATLAHLEFSLGSLAHARGHPDDALRRFEACRDLLRGESGDDDRDLASALNNIGMIYQETGRNEEALATHLESMRLAEARHGRVHASVIRSLTNQGVALMNLGRLEEAAAHHEQAIEISERLDPDSLPRAEATINLGVVRTLQGRHEEAVPAYTEARRVFEARLGPRHPNSLIAALDLGDALHKLHRLDRSIEVLTATVETARAELGEHHRVTLGALSALGSASIDSGDYEAGLRYERAALAGFEAMRGPVSHDAGQAHCDVGHALQLAGELEESLESLRRCETILAEVHGPESPHQLVTLNNLSSTLRGLGELDEAIGTARRAVAIAEQFPDAGPRYRADAHLMLALALDDAGRAPEEVRERAQTALRIYRDAGLESYETAEKLRVFLDELK